MPGPVDELGLPEPQPAAPPELSPDDPRLTSLAAAVQALPPHQQLLVALRYKENLPTREIADRLGLSGDAVRQRLSRLTRRLTSQLADENDARPPRRDLSRRPPTHATPEEDNHG